MADTAQIYFESLIRPKSIVVVGASNNTSKPGGGVARNLVEKGYDGDLYFVNIKGETIMGRPSVTSVDELPDNIDLGFMVIPARGVYQEMLNLSRKNCKTIIVMTAGFGETDEKGKAEENRLIELAGQEGITMIGPNCVGIVTSHYAGKFAGIMPEMKQGGVDFISASGATVDYIMEQACVRGLKFEKVISCGNSAQYGVEDMVKMLDESFSTSDSKIKMIYMESIKKPEMLLKHARSLTEKGCILVGIKSGVSDDGARAAASHTGAMASSDTAVQALFDKAGIIRVRSKYELVEIGCALNVLKRGPVVKKVAIITDAGGPGVLLTDEINAHGVTLAQFKESTEKRIQELIPAFGSAHNPIDCLPTMTGSQIADIVQVLDEEKEDVDVVVVLTGNSMLFDKWETFEKIAYCMEHSKIPVLPVLSPITTTAGLLEKFKELGHVYFVDEVLAGNALGQIARRKPLYPASEELSGYDKKKLTAILDGVTGVLAPAQCVELLDACGFKQPNNTVVTSKEGMLELAAKIGYPLVAKVVGPLHKSDSGGVIVGIRDDEMLEQAWNTISGIDGFKGILLQEMIAGTEVILGAMQEEGYGHLVLFGLGGIFAEILKDTQFSIAPLGLEESEAMVRRIRSIELLEGARGQKGMDIPLLADYVVRLSRLVCDFPQISEIDFNPVKGEGKELYVVDCRIII